MATAKVKKKDLADITKDLKTENESSEKEVTMDEIQLYKESLSAQMLEMDVIAQEERAEMSLKYAQYENEHRPTMLALEAIRTIGALAIHDSNFSQDRHFRDVVQNKLIELLELVQIKGVQHEDDEEHD